MDTEKTLLVNYEENDALNSAYEKSFLRRLSKKRRFILTEIMSDEDWNALIAQRMDSYVLLANDLDLHFAMSAFAPYSELSGLIAFISPHIYSESFLQVFYLRRSLEHAKKAFVHNR